MSVARLARAYDDNELTPLEVVEHLRRVREQLDPELGAFCAVDDEQTQRDGETATQRMQARRSADVLRGIPVAIKDDLALWKWPLRKGSLATDDSIMPAQAQSPSVTDLLRAGAVVLGKTALPEFGWKATTQSPLTGVSRNPWDRRLTPGGSSGGNAIALATGMAPAAVGTDIGGSVRIPASFCGVTGFKPTQTVMSGNDDSKTGLLLHSGPMARTVEDIALLMGALGAQDPSRPKRPRERTRYVEALERDVSAVQIALSPGLGFTKVDPEVEQLVREAAEVFSALGAAVQEVDVLDESPVPTYEALYMPQLSIDVDRIEPSRRDALDPGLLAMAEEARSISGVRVLEALEERRRLMATMASILRHHDLILSATVPILPFAAEDDVPPDTAPHRWWNWTPLTLTYNLTGQPAISVPCGRTSKGLPVGLQIAGPHNRDDLVIAAAYAYQQAGYWPEFAHPHRRAEA